MTNKTLSVIIPVFNAERTIESLIDALLNQKKTSIDYDLIIVDNGSTDLTKDLIQQLINHYYNDKIKYFYYSEKSGSYSARNYGVNQTNADILAFTDSDCIPDALWISSIEKNIQSQTVLSGHIEIEVIDKKNYWELFDKYAHLDNCSNAKSQKVATANMAILRQDFLSVGYFDEIFSGGDHEWSIRAANAGYDIDYNNRVIVKHPSRKSFKEILKKSVRLAYGKGRKSYLNNEKLFRYTIIYFLKIFYIKTNYKYSKVFTEQNISLKNVIAFNFQFTRIRVLQMKAFISGLKNEDPRNLNI